MIKIGIWIDEINKKEEYSAIYNLKNITLIEMHEKELLKEIDGLILVLSNKDNFFEMVDWIFECKVNPALFIWVFSEDELISEKEFLMNLGVNSVCVSKENINLFVLNILNTKKKLLNYSKSNKRSEDVFYRNEGKLVINNKEIFLTNNESKLMSILYDNKNHTVFYEDIINKIWPTKNNVKIYIVANLIFHVREKIKGSQEIDIMTIRGKGYMLKDKNN